jgi:hypothetical protein
MSSRRTVLVVDAGGHPLEPAAQRLRLLGIPALRAKTGAEARAALLDARAAIGAVMIPPDPPTLDLRKALRALSQSARPAPRSRSGSRSTTTRCASR